MLHNKCFEIMKEFLKGYDKKIYGRSFLERIKLSQKNIALTLIELEKEGLLVSEKSGNRRYYSLNFLNPLTKDYLILFENMRKIEFLEKHKNLIDFSGKISGEIVCIFGSYAKNKFNKNSDLDVFIVGKIDSSKVRELGKTLGYDIQIFNLAFADFKKQLHSCCLYATLSL